MNTASSAIAPARPFPTWQPHDPAMGQAGGMQVDPFGVAWGSPVRPRTAPPLDVRRMAKETLLITLLLGINMFGNVGAAVFFLILLGMTIRSPTGAFKALLIMWLGLMMNNSFVPKSLTWTPCRLILPFVALARFSLDAMSMRMTLFTRPFYLVFLLYCFIMAVCSVMSGWYTTIALFKLFNFWAAFTAIFAGAFVLVQKRVDIGEWLVCVIASTTLYGVIAIFTGRSMISLREVGPTVHFGGALLHPNCHSSYASLFIVFLVSLFTFSTYRRRWLIWPLVGMWVLFIIWSKSRTAVVATGLGLGTMLPFVAAAVRPAGWVRRVHVSRTTLLAAGAAACVLILLGDLASGNRITSSVISFANKSDRLNDRGELVFDVGTALTSRSYKIDESMQNFRENPIFGIGFQVAKTEFFVMSATLFTAPAEKGFLPTAVLEEGGLVGTPFFVLFILSVPLMFLVRKNTPALMAFMAFMGSTLTEVTIFSPGGAGGFGWIMVAAAYVFGERCWVQRAPANRGYVPAHVDAARPAFGRLEPLPLGLPAPG